MRKRQKLLRGFRGFKKLRGLGSEALMALRKLLMVSRSSELWKVLRDLKGFKSF
jgi:hypothetical protein